VANLGVANLGVAKASIIAKVRGKNVRHKKSRDQRGFLQSREEALLDFGFFVDHMLANNRVVFFKFELVRSVTLVFSGRVEVTSARAGDQTDFIASAFLRHDGSP
jgi:hypothetical protein